MAMTGKGKTKGVLAIEARQREAEAVRLRAQGMSYADIAHQLGWADHSAALKPVERALDRSSEDGVLRYRQVELARLAALEAEAWKILRADHVALSFGRVAYAPNGTLVLDDSPRLQAIKTLIRLSAQRSKLLGLEAPQQVTVEVITPDIVKQEIERLHTQSAALTGIDPKDEVAMANYLKESALS